MTERETCHTALSDVPRIHSCDQPTASAAGGTNSSSVRATNYFRFWQILSRKSANGRGGSS